MRANDIPDMEKIVFILAALACFLLAGKILHFVLK